MPLLTPDSPEKLHTWISVLSIIILTVVPTVEIYIIIYEKIDFISLPIKLFVIINAGVLLGISVKDIKKSGKRIKIILINIFISNVVLGYYQRESFSVGDNLNISGILPITIGIGVTIFIFRYIFIKIDSALDDKSIFEEKR